MLLLYKLSVGFNTCGKDFHENKRRFKETLCDVPPRIVKAGGQAPYSGVMCSYG